MRLITADQAAELDRKSMNDHCIAGVDLMGAAGKAIAEEVKNVTAEIHNPRIVIVCGKGNNGGDGFATANYLNNMSIQIFSLIEENSIKGDSAYFHELCVQNKVTIYYGIDPPFDFECDLIIDAILGTGCQGELKDDYAKWTKWINSFSCQVLAVDCPTGIDGNRGSAAQFSVRATSTVSMGYSKLGLCIKQGQTHSGKNQSVDIGFPDIINELSGLRWSRLEKQSISNMFTKVDLDTYKHRQGKVLIIAGSKGLTGAAVLTTFGALRSGSGLTVTCAPESIEDIYEKTIIEGMTIGCQDDGLGYLIHESFDTIAEKFDWCDAIVIGPGLGRYSKTMELVKDVIINVQKPLIIDADGLRIFHDNLDLFEKINVPFIITPHEGEFCELLGIDRENYIDSFPQIIEKFMAEFSGVLVLKNAPTITFYQNEAMVNTSGNPGMATAGMGDVLAGILGTFVAQGMECYQAAKAGVFLHGLAADRQVDEKGMRGLIASDLLNELPKVMREFD
ncbi:MAG: NAD(P)H-hydrate dehydratase [Candidatus Marinimicrobia bacterium]|nr:NAD(P)H-hydrate dehydratase [Candidatus Neomarinimicrobiota bacterium]